LKQDLTVTLFTALNPAPPPAPPPPAAASQPRKSPKRTPVLKPVERVIEQEVVRAPVQQPEEPTAESNSAEVQPSDAPAGAGVPGGVAGGVPGGVVGGVPGGTGTQVLPFGPGMTRPVKISGTEPTYSAQALAARVEGKVLVRCVVTVSGSLEQCQVIKGVPLLTEIVLAALRDMHFRPVEYLGHPQAIQYLFTYNFKLP
jgi:protein TonB